MSISNKAKHKSQRRINRHRRVRARIFGVASMPRLCVFRSNRHIFVQLIDDKAGKTLAACDDLKISDVGKKEAKSGELSGKCAVAFGVGRAIALKAKELKIDRAIFDRGGYRYHGRVKNVAEGARQGGLQF